MKVTGPIESLDFDERSGKLRLVNYSRTFWVDWTFKARVKDLKPGDVVTVEAKPGPYYDRLIAIERGEAAPQPMASLVPSDAASPAMPNQPNVSSPQPAELPPRSYTPTREKGLPPTPGKGRACSARFMAKFRELIKSGKTPEEIADEYCFAVQEVYQLRAALETKEKLEQNVSQLTSEPFDTDFDSIRPTHYVELSRVEDPKKQVELARKVAKKQISVKKLREEIQGPTPPPPRREWIDQGIQITCTTCGEAFHLLHLAPGSHKLEPVTVVAK